MSVNKVMLLGNVGQDPDYFPKENNQSVCRLRIATNEFRRDSQGNKVQDTTWHNVKAFGKLADLCGTYLQRGSKVFVEGKLTTRKYTDKENLERYVTEVIAVNIDFLNTKKNEESNQAQPS